MLFVDIFRFLNAQDKFIVILKQLYAINNSLLTVHIVQDSHNEEKRNSIDSDGPESSETPDGTSNKDESTEKADGNLKSSVKP